ncbi:accessory Sec system glycosyltransferase GtfA [Streptococcus pluranimalium]|uniref:accessory Sec system glycosyltransferase GtfA n=1 Tax=Streptococcus pluranimalium TaxID=82348 RepID=UPI003F68FC41
MTVYNINHGIGWASSGVEYAQVYRYHIFQKLGIQSKFIFTDFFTENIAALTQNIGFKDEDIIWLYTYFTDQKIATAQYPLKRFVKNYGGELSVHIESDNVIKLQDKQKDVYLNIILKGDRNEYVHCVEFVLKGEVFRKDFYTYTKSYSEFYAVTNGKFNVYQRRFYNENGSVAYDEFVRGNNSIYRFPNNIFYSKEELMGYFMKQLSLTEQDVVILDRSTGIGQAVFQYVKPAKLGVVVHAEHYSENSVTDKTILWNNYYDYQFSNADKVDFFIVATDKQKDVLCQQFKKYTLFSPKVVTIPVGSIDKLLRPEKYRIPYSAITASRLASEKHIDWLVKAVVAAKKDIPQLTFDIYGSGGEREKLQRIIDESQSGDFIRLMGHHDLEDIYKNYEIYLTASKSEGFGLTLLEAIGSGLPIIGFDVAYGNQTFVKHGSNGYLIPRQETDDESVIVELFRKQIVNSFLNKKISKMSKHSYKLSEDFLTSKVQIAWQSLIKEITK